MQKRTHFCGNQNYRIRYSTCFSIQRRLASIIWIIIATVLTTKPGYSLSCIGLLSSPTPFFFITSSSLSGTAVVKRNALVSHWRRSFTRIESCNRVDISTSHLTHNAFFNIVPFKHLLSSTDYLHHSALKPNGHPYQTPKGTTRSPTLRIAGKILVQTVHKVSSMLHE